MPLPEGVTREELAEDIVSKLKEFECYRGAVNGTWGEPSQDALERFNTLAKLDLPLDEPEPATLDALKDWEWRPLRSRGGSPGSQGEVETPSRASTREDIQEGRDSTHL